MRLTTRELGIIIIIIIIVVLQTFFWSLSIFSFADGGESMAISTETSPWHFDCCPGSDLSWKQSWEERNQAAVSSTAVQLPEPLFLSTIDRGFTRIQPSLVLTSGAAELLFTSLKPFLDSRVIQGGT